jgi:hypothetical protein
MKLTVARPDAEASDARSPAADLRDRALCGWSPPPLPADSVMKRRTDRILAGAIPALAMIAVVVILLNVAPLLPLPAGLAVDGLAALAAGGWCSLNFWRCRHAHCLVTGPAWLALSVFAFTEAGIGRSLIAGDEQLVFLGVLAAALCFEGFWYLARRTNAVTASGQGPALAASSGCGNRREEVPRQWHSSRARNEVPYAGHRQVEEAANGDRFGSRRGEPPAEFVRSGSIGS